MNKYKFIYTNEVGSRIIGTVLARTIAEAITAGLAIVQPDSAHVKQCSIMILFLERIA